MRLSTLSQISKVCQNKNSLQAYKSMKISPTSIYNWYRSTIRNPKYRWWIILGTLVYLLSPFDLSPDFIPIAGALDDFVLVSLLVTEVSQLIMDKYQSRKPKEDFARETNTDPDNVTVDVKAETVSTQKG